MATPSHGALPMRTLGRTGLQVSVLGFGASGLGGAFRPIDEGVGIQAVLAAHKAGINYFDTSPFYGLTRSEQVLGQALKDIPKDSFVLSSKVGRYGDNEFDFSAARVTASVTESLQRLQVPHLDIVLCHDIEFGDVEQVVSEALPALHALKARGLVKHVGFSCLPLALIKRVVQRCQPGDIDVVLSYCHNSLNDSSLLDLLPSLGDIGLISASPMSMGLLTPQGTPDWHPAPPAVKDACAKAVAHAASRGSYLPRLALAHSVAHPRVASTLVGMVTPEEVAQNVEAVSRALGVVDDPHAELDAQVLAEVQQILAPVHNVTWPSGRPDNN
uniref:NADP-dependent oxidoreductase domain-containing protein n=1 Tax=Chlamydomonas leiostraca TaxID=1034604 RepID=A0A7S0WRT9_9CHLO